MCLGEADRQILADHLGHSIKVHHEYYRLPNGVMELAKASKLLLAIESGEIHKFKGKCIDDISIDDLQDVKIGPNGKTIFHFGVFLWDIIINE